jgi:hypothetical protein
MQKQVKLDLDASVELKKATARLEALIIYHKN